MGHRGFHTEMGPGPSGSRTESRTVLPPCCKNRVGEKVGARVPASSHMWMPPKGTARVLSQSMHTWGLRLIGDDAADKVGLSGAQVGHQLVEILL